MQKLEAWALCCASPYTPYGVGRLCTMDNYDNEKGGLVIIGEVHNRDWKDGKVICTAPIMEIKGGIVKTVFGVEYKLGSKHPDFIDFEEAVRKGIPTLRNWALGAIKEGSTYIQGNTGEHEGAQPNFRKKVTYQDGNFVTCYDGSVVFVDWFSIRNSQADNFFESLSKEKPKGSLFCGKGIRPTIFENDWNYWYGRGGVYALTAEKARKYGIM